MQRVLRIQPHSFRSRQNEVDARRVFFAGLAQWRLRLICNEELPGVRVPYPAPKTEIGISVARRFWEPKGPVRLWDLRYLDCPLVHDRNTALSKRAEASQNWRGQPSFCARLMVSANRSSTISS